MNIKEIKAALVDIEVSALELSEGNYTLDLGRAEFKSDCEHIATEARELRDQLTNFMGEV